MSSAVALLLLLVPLSGHGNDLVVQHLDGSGRVSLTGGTGFASQPAWSPDGSQVVFVAHGTGAGDGLSRLDVVSPDGTGLRALTPDEGVGDPVWSPDGTQVAFLGGLSTGDGDVWTIPAGGGAPRRLTSDGGTKAGLAWSPNGATILYGEAAGGVNALYALDPITGANRKLAVAAYILGGPIGTWSPDGALIAFADERGRLSVMAADGSGVRALDDHSIADLPSWSPDGTALAYSARRILPGPPTRFGPNVAVDIWSVDVQSGRSRRLTGAFDDVSPTPWAFGTSLSPSWWPDGSRLFFAREPVQGTREWQMNADGTCEQPLTTVTGATPAWQPGAELAAVPITCADLRVRLVSATGPVALGGAAVTRVAVENDGDIPATGVSLQVSSTRAAHLSLSPCGGPACGVGTIEPGATRTIDAVAGGVRSAAQFDVTVDASADQMDASPGDASVTAGVQVLDCTIVGTDGADDLIGTRKADRICGRPGPDRIDGGKGSDYIDAGNGNDTIVGGPGRDTIIARGGRDVIDTRDGQLDWIDCGTEYDIAIVDRIDHVHGCEKVVRR